MNIPAKDELKHSSEIRAAHVSIAGAVLIFLISLTVGLLADSVTLLLDAGTGFVILVMSFFVRTNLVKASLPPDPRYNFGYGKYEPFTAACQNSAIIFTCLTGIAFAVQDIIHPENITRYDLPVLAAIVSAIFSLLLAAYVGGVARRSGSSMLKASAMHWLIDGGLSLGMSAGFLGGFFLDRMGLTRIASYVDPVMAITLGLLIMRFPAKVLSGHMRELLDGVPEPVVHEKIRRVIEKHRVHFSGFHRMRIRQAGKKIFLDIGFKAQGDLPLERIQALAENFEKELVREVPACDVVVYFKTS